jgi:hypothetical protein
MSNIEKYNKEIFENVATAELELNEIIHGVLENL